MPFLMPIWGFLTSAASYLGAGFSAVWVPVFFEFLRRLNTERNVRRVLVLGLKWLKDRNDDMKNPTIEAALDIVIETLEPPKLGK